MTRVIGFIMENYSILDDRRDNPAPTDDHEFHRDRVILPGFHISCKCLKTVKVWK
jgi:hypothetical protein